jgi:rare lipoprotein A
VVRRLSLLVLIMAGLVLAGCSSSRHASLDPFTGKGSPYYKGNGPIPMGGGRYQVGQPYQVAGRWFTPHEQPNYDKQGVASWYGEAFHRRMTSNGEWFDMNQLTAAHATLPLPSYVKVTNLENGRDVIVRVNDRGPFVGTRVIDVSKRAAEVLGYKQNGTAHVRVQYIGPAPIDDNGSHLMAMNRELQRGTPLRQMIARASQDRRNVQVAAAAPIIRKPANVTVVSYSTERAVAPAPAQSGIADTFYVQVGSFANPANAERARAQLASVWPVQVIEVASSQGSLYRVRLGPISDRADADTALEEAFQFGHKDAHIVVAPSMQAAL